MCGRGPALSEVEGGSPARRIKFIENGHKEKRAGVTTVKPIIFLTLLFAAMLTPAAPPPRGLPRPDRRQQDGPSAPSPGSLQLLCPTLQSLLLPSHRPVEHPTGLDSPQWTRLCSSRARGTVLGQLHLREPAAHPGRV